MRKGDGSASTIKLHVAMEETGLTRQQLDDSGARCRVHVLMRQWQYTPARSVTLPLQV
jgi:hypothetical protein